ncbi:MAG: Flp family type IVb pilin [Terracidiphilus sp.]
MTCTSLANVGVILRTRFFCESGQDLVEYALVVALIALACVAAMKGLSAEIKTAFNVISSDLASSL